MFINNKIESGIKKLEPIKDLLRFCFSYFRFIIYKWIEIVLVLEVAVNFFVRTPLLLQSFW